jgi:hypothetical protein
MHFEIYQHQGLFDVSLELSWNFIFWAGVITLCSIAAHYIAKEIEDYRSS